MNFLCSPLACALTLGILAAAAPLSRGADPFDQSAVPLEVDATDPALAKIVLLAGTPSNKSGQHEYFAGCALLLKWQLAGSTRPRSGQWSGNYARHADCIPEFLQDTASAVRSKQQAARRMSGDNPGESEGLFGPPDRTARRDEECPQHLSVINAPER